MAENTAQLMTRLVQQPHAFLYVHDNGYGAFRWSVDAWDHEQYALVEMHISDAMYATYIPQTNADAHTISIALDTKHNQLIREQKMLATVAHRPFAELEIAEKTPERNDIVRVVTGSKSVERDETAIIRWTGEDTKGRAKVGLYIVGQEKLAYTFRSNVATITVPATWETVLLYEHHTDEVVRQFAFWQARWHMSQLTVARTLTRMRRQPVAPTVIKEPEQKRDVPIKSVAFLEFGDLDD